MKGILYVVLMAAVLLLIPLIAMQFTNDIQWNISDFLVAWGLLIAAGTTYVITTRKQEKRSSKILIGVGVLTLLVLVWAELAVGVFTHFGN